MRTVSGLDVHKDSIFMCILDEQGKKTEERKMLIGLPPYCLKN